MGASSDRARRVLASAACGLSLACMMTLAASARVNTPLFEIKPNPPSAGSDVVVTYFGNNDANVVFHVGDGDDKTPKIGKGKTFTIPKALLKAGRRLCLLDPIDGRPEAALCVEIEP